MKKASEGHVRYRDPVDNLWVLPSWVLIWPYLPGRTFSLDPIHSQPQLRETVHD